MKLAVWRKKKGLTQAQLAAAIGVTQPYVSQIERSSGATVPNADVLQRIFVLSEGAVEPNDWYDLPLWRRMLDGALAVVRKAAA